MGNVTFKFDKQNKYFIENYDVVFQTILPNFLRLKNNTYIDDSNDTCRFCGKTKDTVEFKNKCHAAPEFLGNKRLITRNECDECNHKFGETIETHLAHLTLPTRNITRVHGKNGIPKYKDPKNNNISEVKDDIFFISDKDKFTEFNEEKNEMIINYKTQELIPLMAYKALVKIALNCIPKEYFDKFKNVNWLANEDDLGGTTDFYTKVIVKFAPQIPAMFNLAIFIRKETNTNVPYCQMVLQSNNTFYQVIIPFLEQDRHLENEEVIIEPFSFNKERDIESNINYINLSSKKKEIFTYPVRIKFEAKELISEINSDTTFNLETREKEYSILSYEYKTIKVPNILIPYFTEEGTELKYENGEFKKAK